MAPAGDDRLASDDGFGLPDDDDAWDEEPGNGGGAPWDSAEPVGRDPWEADEALTAAGPPGSGPVPGPADDLDEIDDSDLFAMPLDEDDGLREESQWDHGHPGGAEPRDDDFHTPLDDSPGGLDSLVPTDAGLAPPDDEDTDVFKLSKFKGPQTYGLGSRTAIGKRRKPARLKLAYREVEAMVAEYRDNLRRGGCFVKTEKPLLIGRECEIEVRAPGLDEPLRFDGVVTWSSADQASLPPGQAPGMGIEYRMDDGRRHEIERLLASLAG